MIKKTVFTTFLCLTIFVLVSSANYAPKSNTDKYKVLTALGLFVDDAPDLYQNEPTITRGMFVDAAVRALPLYENFSLQSDIELYKDVDKTSYYSKAIYLAKSMNLIDYSPYFYPEEPIKTADALSVALRLAGYDALLDNGGKSVAETYKSATVAGLTKNVASSVYDKLTRDGAVNILFNLLGTEIMDKTAFGKNERFEISSDLFIEAVLKVYESSGIVSGNADTTLNNGKGTYGYVNVNGESYKTLDNRINGLLGYCVNFYYRRVGNSNDNEIIYAAKTSYNEEICFNAKSIENFSGRTYKYEKNGVSKSLTIPRNISIIYNGRAAQFPFDKFVPKYGDVKLIDNNGGDYDVLIINEYENFLTGSIDPENYTIADFYDPGKKVTLIGNTLHPSIYVKDDKGNSIDPSTIVKFDVLTVYKSSDEKVINVTVCKNRINGLLTAKGDGDIYVDDTRYETTENVEVELNEYGTFYLNSENIVVAFRKNGDMGKRAGYLVKAALSNGISPNVQLRIFSDRNKFEIFDLKKSVRINNTPYDNPSQILALIDPETNGTKLILFTQNDEGKIVSVVTPSDYTDSLLAEQNVGFREICPKKSYLSYRGSSFGYSFRDSENQTKVFVIPSDMDDEGLFNYFPNTRDYFAFNKMYYVTAYNERDDIGYCEYIIAHTGMNDSANGYYDLNPMIISKVQCIEDETGDDTFRLNLYDSTGEVLYDVKMSDSLKNIKLNRGDIICAFIGPSGKIEQINKMFDAEAMVTTGTNPSSKPSLAEWRYIFGNVYSNKEGTLTVTAKDPATITNKSDTEIMPSDKFAATYIFDTKLKQLSNARLPAITDYCTNGNDYTQVFAYYHFADPLFLVIFK